MVTSIGKINLNDFFAQARIIKSLAKDRALKLIEAKGLQNRVDKFVCYEVYIDIEQVHVRFIENTRHDCPDDHEEIFTIEDLSVLNFDFQSYIQSIRDKRLHLEKVESNKRKMQEYRELKKRRHEDWKRNHQLMIDLHLTKSWKQN